MRNLVFVSAILCGFGTCGFAADEGLVGFWRFDKEGDQVADLSGKGNAARRIGGKIVAENERKFMELRGDEKIEVPSKPDLNLKKGFSIEAMVKPTDLSNGRGIVFKDKEYNLRIDWPKEGSKLSFFVYADDKWERRVSAHTPDVNAWHHVIAVWNGTHLFLWVNGEPFSALRAGKPPAPTTNPVFLGSGQSYGAGFVGGIEFVKIYGRALTSSEIIKKTYGIEEVAAAGTESTVFDFSKGAVGWEVRGGAEISTADSALLVKVPLPRSLVMNKGLNANVDKKDFLSLRMSVDKGSRADLIFATTKGAGRMSFQTLADGKVHTYVLEPWMWVGWGGNLLALGIAPSEVEGAVARIEYLRITEELQAEPEIQLMRLYSDSTLPRTERPETVVARMRNVGGAAANLKVALAPPQGVVLKSPASQSLPGLAYQEQTEITWQAEAPQPLSGEFKATVSGGGAAEESLSNTIAFAANPHLAKASYVPAPAPVTNGKYTLWTHYCPLWKQGTHYGWDRIEPWPERKPVIGWYNEGSPEVADWHIKYWLEHGISAVVYCWYRSSIDAPVTVENLHIGHAIHEGLLHAKYLPMMKFAIMWENGCGKGVGSAKDLMENVLPFWIKYYFSHPSYLKVDGKPVLYIWVPRNVTKHVGGSENVRKAFDDMREECKRKGLGGLYIVGCVGSQDKEKLELMKKEGWDASSAYGNNWKPPSEVKRIGENSCAPYEGFVEQQEATWKFKRDLKLLPDITAAMMGWDSRPWKETAFFWSENTAEKFKDLCQRAKKIMDAKTSSGPDKNTIIFCCWNEFGEGHYIEPTRGYGFSYLDAIRDVFTDAAKEHLDIAPEDVGLGPYDSWYQEARKAGPNKMAASTETAWSGEKLAAWQGMMGLGKIEVKDGILSATSTTHDPAFRSPALKVRASRLSKVVIEMRVSKPGTAQLFWTSSSAPQATESASVKTPAVADGAFHPYTFEVGSSEYWGGCLTGLRLDPTGEEGALVEIRSIRME